MSRSNKSALIAEERLRELLGVEGLGAGNTARRLAHLAYVAMRRPDREEIKRQVAWTGNIPTRGLPAWMENSLRWLRIE